MADTKVTVKEIAERLEQGVKDVFASGKFAEYLKTMSRFHNYSTRNTMLIYLQKPNATLVAGFRKWEKEFTRYVKKGERGIQIFAPTPFTIKEERQKIDPVTKMPVIGEDGLPETEEVERHLARFKVIHVFDVSQTDGKPLPSLAEDIVGDVSNYKLFMDTLQEISPLPIRLEPLAPDYDGKCIFGDHIAIREGMSEIQTVCAAIHEITHAKLHDIEQQRLQDEKAKPKDRATEEVEAEGVSYAVCQYYGMDTGANSFGYLAGWSNGRDAKELSASLDIIRKTAAELIDSIDETYRALAKERGIDLTASAEPRETAAVETKPARGVSAKPEKQYDLGFGHMGNGLTVWNRLEEKNNDYVTVAHIDPERSVTFYDKDMPDSVKAQIEQVAMTSDARVSVSQPEKQVFTTPPQSMEPAKDTVQEKPEPAAKNAALDMTMPDPLTTAADRDAYGYRYDDMLPLSNQRAAELFDADHEIFLLYPDNTEAAAFDREEILNHDGLCGIERDAWERSPVLAAQKAVAANSESVRESELLHGTSYDGMFGIYQVKSGDDNRDYRFTNTEDLQKYGLSVERGRYELVYTAPLTVRDTQSNLNRIYAEFQGENPERPADYTGRSVSVSDVIVLQWRGDVSAHYVDSVGFTALPSFTGNEKQPEPVQTNSQLGNTIEAFQQTAQDYTGPTVAELETQARSGQPISILDLAKASAAQRRQGKAQPGRAKGKESVLERLEVNKARVAAQSQGGAPVSAANREVV